MATPHKRCVEVNGNLAQRRESYRKSVSDSMMPRVFNLSGAHGLLTLSVRLIGRIHGDSMNIGHLVCRKTGQV
ncbi:MAG: hypothetical protein LBU43_02270 [Candidatus Accumulibacter sp.]|jgi:hypothetical protein|nr:hypothetical protein [Accumulibacter sp.]